MPKKRSQRAKMALKNGNRDKSSQFENIRLKTDITMNTTDLKEKNFEADIERYLITEGR